MNSKTFSEAMGELESRYVEEALSYREDHARKKAKSSKRIAALIAAVAALIALCGFVSYELGLYDPWLQKASANPVKTVQSAIEGQAGKEYTIAVRVGEIKIDEEETARIRARYTGSELAESRGWTDEYLAEHFIVVWARYYVEYDHTKTFLEDGDTEQYFYLTQELKTGEWTIADNDSPRAGP